MSSTPAMPDPAIPTIDQLLAHTQFVRAMARGVLGGDNLVEDAVQETWLAAMKKGPKNVTSLRSWLGSIGRRRALDLRRRESTRRRYEHAVPSASQRLDTAHLVERAEIGRILTGAMLSLDEKYREALLLRYYEDLRPKDIASRLDMPVETVRTRIKRGLALIRTRLDEQHGSDDSWRATLATWFFARKEALALTPTSTLLIALLIAGIGVGVVVGVGLIHRPPSTDEQTVTTQINPQRSDVARNNRPTYPVLQGSNAHPQQDSEQSKGAAEEGNGATFTIRGRVIDKHGKPVAGVPVSWQVVGKKSDLPRDEDGKVKPIRSTPPPSDVSCGASCGGACGSGCGSPSNIADVTNAELPRPDAAHGQVVTDARGRYKIKNARSGWLALGLSSEEGFGHEAIWQTQIQEDLVHDFQLQGGLVLSGTVSTKSSESVEVRIDYELFTSTWSSVNRPQVRQLTLNEDRTFRFCGLRRGRYRIVVGNRTSERYLSVIELLNANKQLHIELNPVIAGIGHVHLPGGFDPHKTHVVIEAKENPTLIEHTDIAADGRFEFKGVVGHRYFFSVTSTTMASRENDPRMVATQRLFERVFKGEPIDVTIDRDEQVGLRIELPESSATLKGHVEVVGDFPGKRTLRFKAARQGDGTILVQDHFISDASFAAPSSRTEANDWWIRGLPKGSYTLRIVAPGFETIERRLSVQGPVVVTVTMNPIQGRVIRANQLDTFYTIDIRKVNRSEWKTLWRTDARGGNIVTLARQQLEAYLSPGYYVFRVASRNFGTYMSDSIEISNDQTPLDLDFDLPRGATVECTHQSNRPECTLLHVFQLQRDDSWKPMKHKDALIGSNSKCTIKGLLPGTYRLSMSKTGIPHACEFLVETEDISIEFDLDR